MQPILEAKNILRVVALKIIYYFSQCTNALKWWVVVILKFFHGNQKDCLMKKLVLLPHLIKVKPQG